MGAVLIAALYVKTGGSYFGLPDVDPWDEARDARVYAGPHPVIAHPPCQRWGKFWAGQPLWIKRTGQRKIKGDDGGCFRLALDAVRKWGGVLEHPWGSHAWPHFGLNTPDRNGGWNAADAYGGWTCSVNTALQSASALENWGLKVAARTVRRALGLLSRFGICLFRWLKVQRNETHPSPISASRHRRAL
jgi:hypothetical protein